MTSLNNRTMEQRNRAGKILSCCSFVRLFPGSKCSCASCCDGKTPYLQRIVSTSKTPWLLLLLLFLLLPNSAAAQFSGVPDDPFYPEQWALEQIGAPCAWSRTIGRQNMIVAVIDSGVDLNHPDLAPRLRKDGFDFVENDGDPSDENGHGTHVSGIIAATLANAEGIAGLAPDVQILPIRVMNAEGSGNDRRIAAGITYAIERGAHVINLSLGSTLLLATPESSPLVSRAISNALAAGVVVVVAAGNDFVPLPNAIVGANEDVIVVAASGRDDRKTAFSNSGPWVDVTAPGERILSTMPTYEVFLTSDALPPEERFEQGYDYMSGTSQATPYVSALAALILSQNPDYTAAQVVEVIKASATDIYPNHPSYFQRLRLLGAGRIDACRALGGEESAGGILGLILGRWGLALALGGAGICLLGVALVGSLLLLRRRGRPQPVVSYGQASATPPSPPPPAPPPRIGDTLVAGVASWGRLSIVGGPANPATFPLGGSEVLIGRASDLPVSIEGDPTISRRHARITRSAQVMIEDLGSSHGTFVNGRRISGPTALRDGDTVTLGQTSLRFYGS